MSVAFNTAFDRLVGNEGGYVNNPNDPGGETNLGVTWPILHRAIGAGVVPEDTTIKSLTTAQAKAIFMAFFWKPLHCDEMPKVMQFQLADWGYNSGIETGIRGYQRALGVADDGNFGPISLKAARTMVPYEQLPRLIAERIDFFRKLSTWATFGNGWMGRMAADLRYGADDEKRYSQ